MNNLELEKIFGKKVMWQYSHARAKQMFTKEDFNTLIDSTMYILQVESGEVKSNFGKLIRTKVLLSILWAISFILSARALFILVKEPSSFVFAGIPILLVVFAMFAVFVNTLYAFLNLFGNVSVLKTMCKRRKTAKIKIEMLEKEGPYNEAGFLTNYKYLSLIALDVSRIRSIPSYHSLKTERGNIRFKCIGEEENE